MIECIEWGGYRNKDGYGRVSQIKLRPTWLAA